MTATLRRIALLLERGRSRSRGESYRSAAFRGAARTVEATEPAQLLALAAAGRLKDLPGVGDRTAGVIEARLSGRPVAYLDELEREAVAHTGPGQALRAALRGDLHAHTDESDGGSPLQEMVLAAIDLGHDYLTITDHSPRLTVAHGLSPARLRAQIDQIAALNGALGAAGSTFRVLTGIEVDILDDGALDQEPELLAELDVVVASVHSKLRMERAPMTRRLLAAVANPHVDVLGHCTGRQVTGRLRPPSTFDHEAVFAACAEHGVAVEINSRPDRLDPPHALLQSAIDAGCLFTVDTDAHAPGQLDWQWAGCDRAVAHDLEADRVVTTWPVDRLLAWTGRATATDGGRRRGPAPRGAS
ncbi:PHP domain-containing protein [Pengzhenrongella sicca]|uniref:PHP domain-containing protein n=1 Tax=Pengzhenrongella sicca TaxID=2819238 RepID=A0A8A4ZHF4_9MICO|nr:PHP domain-containing protein [Pengzhenrongella sicca]QTE31472.1 PHP domain-containing protein [Pengzhenrongella sicca]